MQYRIEIGLLEVCVVFERDVECYCPSDGYKADEHDGTHNKQVGTPPNNIDKDHVPNLRVQVQFLDLLLKRVF